MKTFRKLVRPLILLAPLAIPLAAAAQFNSDELRQYGQGIIDLINKIFVPVLLAVAFFVFVWGIFKAYFYQGDNEAERAKGHQLILWGVIGFVVIFSIWGIIFLVKTTLGFKNVENPTPPTFKATPGSGGGGATPYGGSGDLYL